MLRLSRLASVLVLLLQVLVVGALPVADARAESQGTTASAVAHVESPDGGSCPRVHDELCQLCPLLRLAGQPSGRVSLPLVARTVPLPTVAREARLVGAASSSPDRARAPPAA